MRTADTPAAQSSTPLRRGRAARKWTLSAVSSYPAALLASLLVAAPLQSMLPYSFIGVSWIAAALTGAAVNSLSLAGTGARRFRFALLMGVAWLLLGAIYLRIQTPFSLIPLLVQWIPAIVRQDIAFFGPLVLSILLVSIGQWLILRGSISHGWLWIPISAASWGASAYIQTLSIAMFISEAHGIEPDIIAGLMLVSLIAGLVYGIPTGITLLFTIHRDAPMLSAPFAPTDNAA